MERLHGLRGMTVLSMYVVREPGKGRTHLLDGRLVVKAVTLQEIDVVRVQALQACVYAIQDVLARQAALIDEAGNVLLICRCGRPGTSEYAGLDGHVDLRDSSGRQYASTLHQGQLQSEYTPS